MAFTSKISNIIKGSIKNKIGSTIGSSIGNFANNLIGGQEQSKKVAAKLLNKSPLEIENVNPTSHMKENPYQYGSIYYPAETANLGEGHYVIFDVIMHNSSKFKAANFSGTKITKNQGLVGENEVVNSNGALYVKKAGFNVGNRVDGVGSGINQRSPTHSYISDSIILYTPAPSLKFDYSVSYDMPETGLAGLLGQSIGSFKDAKGFREKLKSMGDAGADALSVLGRKAIFGAASLIPGMENAEAAYDKAQGQAVNPQMEVVFKSVAFRSFDFPFEFAPKNPKEKDAVHKIINMFKFHMLPEYQGTTKGFFNVPSEFQITYMYREARNTYIPRVSRCVLKDMKVDYAPEGVFSTFIPDEQGAAPVLATMSLSFTETEIMTKERVADGF